MKMAFELPPPGSGGIPEGKKLGQTSILLDEQSSGSGIARAVVLGIFVWAIVLGTIWLWVG
jgi:hypothetical protein